MNRVAFRAWIVGILAAILLAGFSFFIVEFIYQGPQWLMSENSPHMKTDKDIPAEQWTVDEGYVVDRDGILLLDISQNRSYHPDSIVRKATLHWLGGRDRNIVAPLLANFNEELLGFDALSGTYTYGDSVPTATLTLSSQVQKDAYEALEGRKGTVMVINYRTGQILCAVTAPSYDPDQIPQDLESNPATSDAYYNKLLQFKYIPGSIFKVVTLAAAAEELEDLSSLEFYCDGSYEMGVDVVKCTGNHGTQNIQQAFRNSCNCAFAQLSEVLGTETLAKYVEQFGIVKAVSFDGMTTVEGRFDQDASAVNVAWSAIGQFTNQINPCAFLNFISAIARGGSAAQPYMMQKIQVDGDTTYQAKTQVGERIMSPQTAQLVQAYMRSNVTDSYGDWNFPGLTVCAKTGTAEVGGDKKPNAMFTGFVADEEYPLAFIICVEDAGSGGKICIPIAAKVLASCKAVMDS